MREIKELKSIKPFNVLFRYRISLEINEEFEGISSQLPSTGPYFMPEEMVFEGVNFYEILKENLVVKLEVLDEDDKIQAVFCLQNCEFPRKDSIIPGFFSYTYKSLKLIKKQHRFVKFSRITPSLIGWNSHYNPVSS